MDLKLNKTFTIVLIIITLMTYLIGLPIVAKTFDIIYPDNVYSITWYDLVVANFKLTVSNLSQLIIGCWLFLNAEKFKQGKWTWLLIGLVYGEYGLILLGIVMVIQNIDSRIDLFNSLRPILILLIITFFLSMSSNALLTPYLALKLSVSEYSFIMEYSAYLSFTIYGIMILMNIVLSFKLNAMIKQLEMTNKSIWIVSTLFLGLFPIILFNELRIISKSSG